MAGVAQVIDRNQERSLSRQSSSRGLLANTPKLSSRSRRRREVFTKADAKLGKESHYKLAGKPMYTMGHKLFPMHVLSLNTRSLNEIIEDKA